MENQVAQTFEKLEELLDKKVRELREQPDQKESKERRQIQNWLNQLSQTLHDAVNKTIAIVTRKVNRLLDPLSHVRKEINEIER